MTSAIIFSLFAAYAGVGALLVYDMDFKSSLPGWRGQTAIAIAALVIAITWPRFAWRYAKDLFQNGF